MSISEKLLELNTIKEDLKTSLTNKGQAVGEDMTTYAFAIDSISPKLQTKTVSPTTSSQTVSHDAEYDGLEQVTVNAIQTETSVVTHSRSKDQTIVPSSGKFFSQITVPRGVGLSLIHSDIYVSTGNTETYTITTEIDPPITTSGSESMMSTIFIVVLEDDDLCEPVSFPFCVFTDESNMSSVKVTPNTGYSAIYVPSDSANHRYFESSVNLTVPSFTVTEEGVGTATIQVTVTTESKSAEFNCYVYKLEKMTYIN